MPELPEVEQFRKILLPLVSEQNRLEVALTSDKPPRSWISHEDAASLHQNVYCTDVLRKGKLLCMVLKQDGAAAAADVTTPPPAATTLRYLFLHMGMTGTLRSPTVPVFFGNHEPQNGQRPSPMEEQQQQQKTAASAKQGNDTDNNDEEEPFPPPYTHLTLQAGDYRVAFTDPRKFGKCELSDNLSCMDELAPDALLGIATKADQALVLPNITNQSMGIKALLLDQKRAVSGVGNWVADEVLYQCQLHPDQSYLTDVQAQALLTALRDVLETAVDCLAQGQPYPPTWLFHYRWTKKKAGKDSQGRSLTFLKSGGRTSAIVASVQKLWKMQKRQSSKGDTKNDNENTDDEGASSSEKQQAKRPNKPTRNGTSTPAGKRKRPPSSAGDSQGNTRTAAQEKKDDSSGDVSRRRRSPRFATSNIQG